MKKELFIKYPFITCFGQHANFISILSQYDDYIYWFYENYTNLYGCNIYSEDHCFINFCIPSIFDYCPWLEVQRVDPNYFINNGVLESSINAINNNYYLYLCMNRFYIPLSNNYKKNNFSHDTFVYGYNDTEKIINIVDYYGNPSFYSFAKISYDNYIKAVSTATPIKNDFLHGVLLIKVNNIEPYRFDINKCVSTLSDYLNCKESFVGQRYTLEYDKDDHCLVYGMNIYKMLISHVSSLNRNPRYITMGKFQLLIDHKEMLFRCITYLSQVYLKNNDNVFQKRAFEILNLSKQVKNLMLKYSISKNTEIINRIVDLFKKIENNEYILLTQLLSLIK